MVYSGFVRKDSWGFFEFFAFYAPNPQIPKSRAFPLLKLLTIYTGCGSLGCRGSEWRSGGWGGGSCNWGRRGLSCGSRHWGRGGWCGCGGHWGRSCLG